MTQLNNTIATINNALKTNSAICSVKKTKMTKQLLKKLNELGIVSSIQSHKDKWIVLLKSNFLDSGSAAKWSFRSLIKPSKKNNVTNYKLKSLQWKHRRSFFLYTTADAGLILALNSDVSTGGTLVAVISSK